MKSTRSPQTLLIAAAVAFVAVLLAELVFGDTIDWVTVVIVPVATVVGIIVGDRFRSS